ncbi:MAG: hypothetical protein EBS37_17240 [Betaproteobacteria bacterium]|nr:hypothetical protein [Betaproteobacteria bacterium]
MPSLRLIDSVPCATPKCTGDGTKWCDDERFIPFAEDARAGAWFCRPCSWQPKLPDSAFVVPATAAWDAWAEIEAMENAVDGEGMPG